MPEESTADALFPFWRLFAHKGVIFVDDRTIAPNDFGGIVRALDQLWEKENDADWTNRVIYLRRAN